MAHRKTIRLLATVLVAGSVLPALAASEEKEKLDARVTDLTEYFVTVQRNPETAVPAEILRKAEGLIIMRTYKAGFIVGVAGGHGVGIVKDKKTGTWGPVAFLKAGEGSFGFQAGGQRADMILVLMNKEGVRLLTEPNLKVGVDVRATLGPKSSGDQANLKTDDAPVLLYSDTRGVFGGASLQTGSMFPDQGDNVDYYGKKLTMSELLVGGKIEPSEKAKALAEKIEQYSKPATAEK